MLDAFLTWAEIDLDAIIHNVQAFKAHVGQRVEVMAVVKANAYGHGAVPVAKAALEAGAGRLAVHRVLEGIELRQAGIKAPILVMGYTPPEAAKQVVEWKLIPSMVSMEFARALSAIASSQGAEIPVHVKVDSGLSRFGLFPDDAVGFLEEVRRLAGIRLEGLYTHFATADSSDDTWVRRQLKVFSEVRTTASEAGIHIPVLHAANSAAAMRLPETHFNAVRIGIAMYGLNPSNEWEPVFPIRPALVLKSRVDQVKTLPQGAGVSYGRTYITRKPTRVALVSIGYGDGYHRILSNQGGVLIHGRKAPLIGRVCMDQFVVDCNDIPEVQQDDEVVVIGSQGNERISAEEIAVLAGTINYEITTSLLPRVSRVYLRGGRVIEIQK